MYSKKAILLLAILPCIVSACGPSEKEARQREQVRMDSVANATQQAMLIKAREEADAKAAQEEAEEREQDQTVVTRWTIKLQGELEAEEAKLEDIKVPQFLRSTEERESAIRQQLNVISELRAQIAESERTLNKIQRGAAYDMDEIGGVVD